MTQRSGWTDTELARLRLEGLDHLNHLQSGEATDQDAAMFLAWRGQSRAHEEAFRSALRLRALVRTVESEAPASATNVVPFDLPARDRRAVTRRFVIGGAIAASAAGATVLVGRTMGMVPSPSEALAAYRTGPGQRRVVQLADGARVDLNTRTAIDLRSDLGMPAVELLAGEALLSSGKAGSVALVAGAGTSVVRAGRVNARREGEEICITCLAGETQVRWGQERRALRAADEVRYTAQGIGAVRRGLDAAVLTAWQSGTLIFRQMPLRQVVAELNRYRRGRIFLTNEAMASRPMSGTYYVDRLDDFFSQAELALGLTVWRLPGNVVVLG